MRNSVSAGLCMSQSKTFFFKKNSTGLAGVNVLAQWTECFQCLEHTHLLSALAVAALGEDSVWELDIRDTNFWMVLREGALILELRLL